MAPTQSENQCSNANGRINKRKRTLPVRLRTNQFVGMPILFSKSVEPANSQQDQSLDNIDKPEQSMPILVWKGPSPSGRTEEKDSLQANNETDTILSYFGLTPARKLRKSPPLPSSVKPEFLRRSHRNVTSLLDKQEARDEEGILVIQQVNLIEEKRKEIRIRNRALCVLRESLKEMQKKKHLQDLRAVYEMWQNCKKMWTELDEIQRKVAFIKRVEIENTRKN